MASYDEAFKNILTGVEQIDKEKDPMNIPLKGSYNIMESTTMKKNVTPKNKNKNKNQLSELKFY